MRNPLADAENKKDDERGGEGHDAKQLGGLKIEG